MFAIFMIYVIQIVILPLRIPLHNYQCRVIYNYNSSGRLNKPWNHQIMVKYSTTYPMMMFVSKIVKKKKTQLKLLKWQFYLTIYSLFNIIFISIENEIEIVQKTGKCFCIHLRCYAMITWFKLLSCFHPHG